MMTPMMSVLGSTPARALGLLLFEVTVLLGLAAFGVRMLARSPAAVRHLLWAGVLGAVLILAAGLLVPSGWRLDVGLPALAGEVAALRPDPVASGPGTAAIAEPTPVPSPAHDASGAAPPGAGTWLLLVWAAGGLAVAARRGRAALWSARALRRASPVTDGDIRALLERTARRVGVRRRVRLLWRAEEGSPGTCGVLRPAVFLPPSARGWSAERMELVLLHELLHVSRADTLTELVADLACAAVWMHPGVWAAARRLREERERACDEAVVGHGVGGHRYARELVSIAGEHRGPFPSSVIAMADGGPTALERRLRWILSARPPLRPLGRPGVASVLAVVLLPAAFVACAEVTGPGVESAAEADVAEVMGPSLVQVRTTGLPPTGDLLPDAYVLSPSETAPGFARARSREEPRLGCWGTDNAPGPGRHAVVLLFAGVAEAGTVRLRLVPERLAGNGAGLASVRHHPGMRCWKAGVAGARLGGAWGPDDLATLHYSENSELYFATVEGVQAQIDAPAGSGPFECSFPTGTVGSLPSCRPADAGEPGISRESVR